MAERFRELKILGYTVILECRGGFCFAYVLEPSSGRKHSVGEPWLGLSWPPDELEEEVIKLGKKLDLPSSGG